jgi:hypothetical protein
LPIIQRPANNSKKQQSLHKASLVYLYYA